MPLRRYLTSVGPALALWRFELDEDDKERDSTILLERNGSLRVYSSLFIAKMNNAVYDILHLPEPQMQDVDFEETSVDCTHQLLTISSQKQLRYSSTDFLAP